MTGPITRPSLVAETVRSLRASIQKGEYGPYLPPERGLSSALNVSRPTLRAALAQLEREGFIDKQGKNARKTLVRNRRRKHSPATKSVRLLQVSVPEAFEHLYLDRNYFLAEHLGHAGIDFQVECFSPRYLDHPDAFFDKLVQSRNPGLWLLRLSTAPIQQWFWRRKLPCLVLGSVVEGVGYPSLDVDWHATCRHAAGMLLSRHHRSLAVIGPDTMRGGDRRSLDGFAEGVERSGKPETRWLGVSCSESAESAMRTVDDLLQRDERPDGWLIMKQGTFMTVHTYLASLGVRVGKDISLICRDSDLHFSALVPSAAHYRHDAAEMNRRLLRLISVLLRGGRPGRIRILVHSKFTEGDSLRPAGPADA